MAKVLIVYYSRTGNTGKMTESIGSVALMPELPRQSNPVKTRNTKTFLIMTQ